jgi:hypothetical protein
MAWTYVIPTGQLFGPDHKLVATGWAGHGAGKNNPAMQDAHGVGPLPVGVYLIGKPVDPPNHLGPLAMPLTPAPANVMHNRGDFFMHGASATHLDLSSDGCIMMDRFTRQMVFQSPDKALYVSLTPPNGVLRMSEAAPPNRLGYPNSAGAPTTRDDQVLAAAQDVPDLIAKAASLDAPLVAKWTGKALLASKSFYGAILVLALTAIAKRYALGWDQDTVDIVAGLLDLTALGALRAVSDIPITGFFRKATPAEAIAKIVQAP